jgi:ABC-type spermidine/putrescine transport system permease subunit II
MVAPLMAIVAVFLLFPMANAIYYAFVDFDGINPNPPWFGLANLTELARDADVWAAFRNNVIWIVIGTIAPLMFGLALPFSSGEYGAAASSSASRSSCRSCSRRSRSASSGPGSTTRRDVGSTVPSSWSGWTR